MATSHYFEIWSIQGFSETDEMEYQRFVRRNFLSFCGDSKEEFEAWFADTETIVRFLPASYQTPEHQIYIINHLLEGSAREIFLAYHDDWIFDLHSLHRLFSTFFVLSPSLRYISKYVWEYPCHELCRLLDHSHTNDCHTLTNSTSSAKLYTSDASPSIATSEDWPTSERATSTWDDTPSFPSSITSTSLEPATEAASRQSSPSRTFTITESSTSPMTEHSHSELFISIPTATPSFTSSMILTSLEPVIETASRQSLPSSRNSTTQTSTSSPTEQKKLLPRTESKIPFASQLLPLSPTVAMISPPLKQEQSSFFSVAPNQSQLKPSIKRRKRSQRSPKHRNRKRQYRYGPHTRQTETVHPAQRYCYLLSISQLLQQKYLRLSSLRRKSLFIRFKMKHTSDRASSKAPTAALNQFHYARPPDLNH